VATAFYTVVYNVCVSSVWALFHVTFGAKNFDMALRLWKIYALLL